MRWRTLVAVSQPSLHRNSETWSVARKSDALGPRVCDVPYRVCEAIELL